MSGGRFARYAVVAQRFGARTVLFQGAAARRLNLSVTQLECFQLVRHEGPLTAVDLARETGLTQASLSVIIDKLVDKEFLSRKQDRADRRRWILKAKRAAVVLVDSIYSAHARRTAALLDEYRVEQFDTALRFMDRLAEELKVAAIEFGQSRPVDGA
jgi:DNA-binding MarR family transcriptional regulator